MLVGAPQCWRLRGLPGAQLGNEAWIVAERGKGRGSDLQELQMAFTRSLSLPPPLAHAPETFFFFFSQASLCRASPECLSPTLAIVRIADDDDGPAWGGATAVVRDGGTSPKAPAGGKPAPTAPQFQARKWSSS